MAQPQLENVDLFRGLTPQQLESVAQIGRAEQAASGAVLFRLGADADRFYVLERGRVVLTLPMDVMHTVQDAFVEELGAGQMVGWSALVSPHKYTMSARVTVEADLVAWSGKELRELIARDTVLGLGVMQNLTALICRRLHGMQAMWARELQRTIAAKLR